MKKYHILGILAIVISLSVLLGVIYIASLDYGPKYNGSFTYGLYVNCPYNENFTVIVPVPEFSNESHYELFMDEIEWYVNSDDINAKLVDTLYGKGLEITPIKTNWTNNNQDSVFIEAYIHMNMSFEAVTMMDGNTSWMYNEFQNYTNVTIGLEMYVMDNWHDSDFNYRYACLARMDYSNPITQSGWSQYPFDEYFINDIYSTPRSP